MIANGDSLSNYIFKLTLVVHEAYHTYSFDKLISTDKRKYRLNDSLTIEVDKIETFPSREINKVVNDSNNVSLFRYKTYINTEIKTYDTQQNGLLGLLEEYTTYYQEFKTYNALMEFLKTEYGYSNAEIWQKYLCDIGSVRYSLDEFEIFTILYFKTAKLYYPDIYDIISTDADILELLDFLKKENKKLKHQYDLNRIEILSATKDQMTLDGEWLRLNQSQNSKGIHDAQALITKTMLTKLYEK